MSHEANACFADRVGDDLSGWVCPQVISLDQQLGPFCFKCNSIGCVHSLKPVDGKFRVSSEEIVEAFIPNEDSLASSSGALDISFFTYNCLSLSPQRV